ncbi:MAG TPA: serine/threonine-protein kinase, partial [Ktedonobacteraceae bacterium]
MNAEALIGSVLGTCTLQRLIGQGGMGAVYLAQQTRPRRQVAVKVLMPAAKLKPHQLAAFLERFRRETDAAASLEHPNIMPVHEYGERDSLAYLVMPYISGGTLRDVMEREGPLDLSKAMYYLDQLAAALDFAHARGVIHRDIKPANILLTPEDRLLLTDFGLVKVISEGQGAQTRLTGEGAPVGTPDYMSPEQVMGEEVDGRADLYSLGVILYQMVTGATPFQGETPMQIAAQQLHMQPASPRLLRPDLPIAAEQVMLRMLAKRPANRFPTGREFAMAFQASVTSSKMPSYDISGGTILYGGGSNAGESVLFTSRSDGLLDSRWQTGTHASVSNEQIGGNPTGVLPAASADVPVRSTGLLSRTGMFPKVGTTGMLPAAHASHQIPDTPAGPLPAQITGQLTSPQIDFNGMGMPFHQMPGNEGLATSTGALPTVSGIRPAVYPSALNQMSPDLKTTSGSLAVPNYEQGNTGNTVKLTGPVKIVKVPVAGQPGQYITGLLSVPTGIKPPATAKSASKKIQVVGLLIALVILLAGGSLGLWYMHGHTSQVSPSQSSGQTTVYGTTPN